MSNPAIGQREPISDSPWFWLYLFATVALILLVVFRGKLDIRQANIERQHQARQISQQPGEAIDIDAESLDVSTPGDTLIGWNYLIAVLGSLVAIGWIRLWYVRFRATDNPPAETSTSE
ncbi:hypothetical protein ACYFX5_05840 [Bremerella sp. T1]|uniref:hypothetical protein n=1 Tax=Bremerella sp. TYQ1 TaxID=3119568 RepID=UPI001CCFB1CF|nr:hypothetical protein [Bremerella volcania]UBM37779.1 hypothetical protein LA756_07780 [Bremerella volcania]